MKSLERKKRWRNIGYGALAIAAVGVDTFAGFETYHAFAVDHRFILPTVALDAFLLGADVPLALSYFHYKPRLPFSVRIFGLKSEPDSMRDELSRNDRRNRNRLN